jgi:outer membrane receptor protein involved in Fe transport
MGRVEVVRGASGSLYGADAMGGVVNFLTPDITMPGGDWHAESHLYSSWNSADSGLVMRAETRAGKDGTAFSGGITWQNHHDRRTGGGQTVRPSGYRSRAANLKWMLETGPDADLVLSVQWLEQPSTPRTDELVPGYGQAQPASEQFAFQPNHRGFVHARYRAASSLDWLDQYQVSFARQVITDDRLTQDFGETVVRHEQNDSAMNGLTLQFDHERASGTAFSWGFDHYQDTISSHRTETELTGGTVEDVRSRFPDQSKMDSTAAWLSAEWAPAVRWTIGAGLRYSRTELRLPETTTSPAADLSPDGVSGDLRLIYALSPSVNLVGNAGRGFRPPNIFDLGTLGNRPGNRFNVANTSLGAESVNSYDLGFKVRQGRWQSELFVFYLDYHDKISSVATGEMTATGRTVVRSANLGEATLYGLEAGFAWTGDGHELYGTLNYTRGEEAIEGVTEPADRIPPLNGRLGVRYWISDQLQLDAQLQFAGRQDRLSARDVDDPRINPSGTPGWTTINLTARWRPNDDLELGLRLENLADRSYREHGSGIDAPGLNIGAWISLNF